MVRLSQNQIERVVRSYQSQLPASGCRFKLEESPQSPYKYAKFDRTRLLLFKETPHQGLTPIGVKLTESAVQKLPIVYCKKSNKVKFDFNELAKKNETVIHCVDELITEQKSINNEEGRLYARYCVMKNFLLRDCNDEDHHQRIEILQKQLEKLEKYTSDNTDKEFYIKMLKADLVLNYYKILGSDINNETYSRIQSLLEPKTGDTAFVEVLFNEFLAKKGPLTNHFKECDKQLLQEAISLVVGNDIAA